MKETRFIEQNRQGWKEFDDLMKGRKKDPEKLSELFIRLTDDLSYARTFYPRRSVRVFLNNQAQKVFINIYRNKRFRGSRFVSFWKDDIPNIIWHSRRELLLSLLMTLLFIGIGVFSSNHDTDFAGVILGQNYIRMTEENISAGDPMAVYKEENEVIMFLKITKNNLQVDLMIFVFGIFFSVGSVWMLLRNGVMLGAFQTYFIQKGLFWPSFLTIFQHGTLEISAMVISGAAGLALGRGLLFPGTYSRLQAFQLGAVKALKLFISVIPITIMAGFIEGFITRHTDVPDAVRLSVILLSLTFIILYYVILPRRKAGKAPEPPELRPSNMPALDVFQVRSSGEIFTTSFQLLRRSLLPFLLQTILMAGIMTTVLMASGNAMPELRFDWMFLPVLHQVIFIGILSTAYNVTHMLRFDLYPYAAILIGILFIFTSLITLWRNVRLLGSDNPDLAGIPDVYRFSARNFHKAFFLVVILMGSGFLPATAGSIFFFLLLPVLLLWLVVTVMGKENIYESLLDTLSLIGQRIGRIYGVYIVFFLLAVILLVILASPVSFLFMDIVKDFLPQSMIASGLVFKAAYLFMISFILAGILVLLLTGFTFLYFTFREISEAVSLRSRIHSTFRKE